MWLKSPRKPAISKYIACYWFLEKKAKTDGDDYPKLNPDPSAHLIISPSNQVYKYGRTNEVSQGKGTHVIYPYCNTLQLDHSMPQICLGIKFHVGALYSLRELNVPEISLNTINGIIFDDIKGEAKINENELLELAITTQDKCIDTLDEIFMPLFMNTHEDRHSDITRKILPLLETKQLNEIGASLNCSQRTVERSFLRVTGLTLKQCQSMNKLEAILEFLYQREQKAIDWVDIAYQFGFSDQPHLIRYLKKQINLTPKDYTLKRGFTIDVYGGVNSQ
jgi:AraC-like DNA-binding protein